MLHINNNVKQVEKISPQTFVDKILSYYIMFVNTFIQKKSTARQKFCPLRPPLKQNPFNLHFFTIHSSLFTKKAGAAIHPGT